MKKWELSNLVETRVSTEHPGDWSDKPKVALCPPGWLLIIDAENDVVAMAPANIANMLVTLLNTVETTNTWEDPYE